MFFFDCYVSLPFYGSLSYQIRKELNKILKPLYPQTDFRFIFNNKSTIGSLFPFKDKAPKELIAMVTYEFKCPSCEVGYIGKTSVNFTTRVHQHLGKSAITKNDVQPPSNSAVYNHSKKESHAISEDDFSIINICSTEESLDITEAIQIKLKSPKLNGQLDVAHLYTLWLFIMSFCKLQVISYFFLHFIYFTLSCITLRERLASSGSSAVSRAVTACCVVRITLIHVTPHPSCYPQPSLCLTHLHPSVVSLAGIVKPTNGQITMIVRYVYYMITLYLFVKTTQCRIIYFWMYHLCKCTPPQQSIGWPLYSTRHFPIMTTLETLLMF